MKAYKLLYFLFIPFLSACYHSENLPMAQNGLIDLRNWDFEKNGNIELNGEWEFYWNELIDPETFLKDSLVYENMKYIKVPDIWSTRKIDPDPSFGYATYRLKVLMKNEKQQYGIKLIDCGTSYRFFINDSLIAMNGKVSKTKDKSQAQYIPLIKEYTPTNDSVDFVTLQIVVQCSNYNHSKAGFWEPIKVGRFESIFKDWKIEYSIYIVLTAAIFMIFIIHVLLFFMRRAEKMHFYFGIFSLLILIRNLTVNVRLLFQWFPDFNFEIYEKLEYISAYGTPIVLGLFFYYLYQQDFHKAFLKVIHIIGLIVILSILILPLYYFSQIKIFYNAYILITAFYVTFYLMPITIIRKRKYAQLLFFGVLNLFFAAVFDIVRSSQVVHFFYLTPLSLVIYMFIQTIVLSHKYTDMFNENERLIFQLNFQNKNLEKIVFERTEEIEIKNDQLKGLLRAKENLLQIQEENARLKEEELKRSLEVKEKELTTHTLLMVQKQNMLTDFIEKLNQVKNNSSSEINRNIDSLENQIKNISNVEENWKDFKMYFEQVHMEFFHELQLRFPDLTPGEIKLCALTRLNLNIKETASLLNISPNSVKVSRYRLKKKMGLEPEQNLSIFLSGLK